MLSLRLAMNCLQRLVDGRVEAGVLVVLGAGASTAAFARRAASRPPSADHCSNELSSLVVEAKKAVRKFACVWRAAEEVRAGPHLPDGVHRLCVLREIHPLEQARHLAAEIGVEDRLLVARDEPALEPPGGVVDEVRAGQHRHQQRPRAFLPRLPVRQLRRRERAHGVQGHPEPARELAGCEHHLPGLRRAEGGCAAAHRHGARERAHEAGSAGIDELHQAERRERLGEHLGERSRRRCTGSWPRRASTACTRPAGCCAHRP